MEKNQQTRKALTRSCNTKPHEYRVLKNTLRAHDSNWKGGEDGGAFGGARAEGGGEEEKEKEKE